MIDVFCSVSKSEMPEVEALLIPSLAKQITSEKIRLTLTNYTGNGEDFPIQYNGDRLEIQQIHAPRPFGYGEAHNFAFNEVKPGKYFIVTNPVYFNKNAMNELIKSYESETDVGIIEARQLPYSHPKNKGVGLHEVDWASGCTMFIDADFFSLVGGFDENYWMYLEDVDLSWRSWLNDRRVLQQSQATVYHYTGVYHYYKENRLYIEHFWSYRNFFYIMEKFFGSAGLEKAKKLSDAYLFPKEAKIEAFESYRSLRENTDWSVVRDFPKEPSDCKQIKVSGFNVFTD